MLIIELFANDKVGTDETYCNIAKQLILANSEILDQYEDNNSEYSRTPIMLVAMKAEVKNKPEIEKMFLDVVRKCVPNHPSVAPIQTPVELSMVSEEEQQTPADQELRHRRNIRTTTAQVVEQLVTAEPIRVMPEIHYPEVKQFSWVLSWITGKLFSGEVDQQKQPLLTSSTRSDSPSVEAY